mmetsp:Transcript_18113/g.57877  ORF Transcript_18113/g.57877 Transcript_18113/m.57877 type:complete len:314 (+) Transcript_18113:348-1289(+)
MVRTGGADMVIDGTGCAARVTVRLTVSLLTPRKVLHVRTKTNLLPPPSAAAPSVTSGTLPAVVIAAEISSKLSLVRGCCPPRESSTCTSGEKAWPKTVRQGEQHASKRVWGGEPQGSRGLWPYGGYRSPRVGERPHAAARRTRRVEGERGLSTATELSGRLDDGRRLGTLLDLLRRGSVARREGAHSELLRRGAQTVGRSTAHARVSHRRQHTRPDCECHSGSSSARDGEQRDQRRVVEPVASGVRLRGPPQLCGGRIVQDGAARHHTVHAGAVGGLRVELHKELGARCVEVDIDERGRVKPLEFEVWQRALV